MKGEKVKSIECFGDLSCSELKSMLHDKKIDLSSLDTSVLKKLMDGETDALCLGAADEKLIEDCAKLICERENGLLSYGDFMRAVENAGRKDGIRRLEAGIKKRKRVRRVAAAAGVLLALVADVTFAASAFDFDLSESLRNAARSHIDDLTVNILTLHSTQVCAEYDTMEEFLASGESDILYPSQWPSGVSLSKVRVSESAIGEKSVDFITERASVGVHVELYYENADNSGEGEEYVVFGRKYRVFQRRRLR